MTLELVFKVVSRFLKHRLFQTPKARERGRMSERRQKELGGNRKATGAERE